jgi:Leucine-rich repeat (LRR) protein
MTLSISTSLPIFYPVLDDNLISGALPEALSSLKHLSKFSVSRKDKPGRKLTGPLPRFHRTPELSALVLDGNYLSGTIPNDFLSSSLAIQSVDLSRNLLSGTVPPELDSLSAPSLFLTNNRITGLPSVFCDNAEWMRGDVGRAGCDAILCPPATANRIGRVASGTESCSPCGGKHSGDFYGSTTCGLPVDEREVLILFFLSTGGDNWLRNDFWATAADICDWFGVGCDEWGAVILLNLQGNNLVGGVPPSIFNLPKLQVLWLSMNALDFSLNNIGNAVNLLDLRLGATGIKSLKHIDSAKSLTVLDVRSNSLAGHFPSEVFQLRNLRMLDMGLNALSGPVPSFEQLRLLRVLRLDKNKFDGNSPAFNNSVVLSDINLSDNRLNGHIPTEFLAQVPISMKVRVDLSGNAISGTIPKGLERFSQIRITLDKNQSQVSSSSNVIRAFGLLSLCCCCCCLAYVL